ncbi:MAG: helix-turn-helix transcriptional regulator [Spirochaetales bacterium]|nr:helix-turn-helix transcriptional regulator [Spirochaetales bacterium]
MSRITTIAKRLVLLIPLFVIIPTVSLLVFFNKPLTIFPGKDYRDRIVDYADDELGGNSRIIAFNVLENKIIFTYVLGKSGISSFAGISFDVSLLDISAYDIMEIHIAATTPAHYLINLMAFIEGESRLSELDTFAHFNKEIDVKAANQVYKIDVTKLVKTEYDKLGRMYKKKPGNNRPTQLLFIHLKEMINVDNMQESSWSFDKVKTIIIEEISFHRSNRFYYLLLVIAVILYYGVYFSWRLLRKKPGIHNVHRKNRNLPFIQLKVESYEEEDLKKIMSALQEHVFEPEFSIHTVYNITGQSTKRIVMIIQDKYDLSFKQLVNSIRLNEAKRLLLKSDLKIYDIAFKIGYNNNTYFCKLFKKHFGVTPKEYRSGQMGE